jgi:hypothetical protein
MDFYLAVRKYVRENGAIPIELDRTDEVKVYFLDSDSTVVSYWVKVRFIGTVWYGIDNDLQNTIISIDYTDIFPLGDLPFDAKSLCNKDGSVAPFDSLWESIEIAKHFLEYGYVFREDYVLPRVAKHIGYTL